MTLNKNLAQPIGSSERNVMSSICSLFESYVWVFFEISILGEKSKFRQQSHFLQIATGELGRLDFDNRQRRLKEIYKHLKKNSKLGAKVKDNLFTTYESL